MKKVILMLFIASLVFMPATLLAFPSVFPTGTTIYKPDKCWNGYTVLSLTMPRTHGESRGTRGVPLIDMNGNIVHTWKGAIAMPAQVLPGGRLMGTPYDINVPGHTANAIAQFDFNGNIEWQFNRYAKITQKTKDGKLKTIWSALQHHDLQREPNPVGYYVPGMDPYVDKGRTLVHGRASARDKGQTLYEVSWDGKILWKWSSSNFVDQIVTNTAVAGRPQRPGASGPPGKAGKPGASGPPGKAGKPGASGGRKASMGNAASWLGPNKWYEAGDKRFHPDNIICDNLSDIIFIVSRETGKIVWQVGPDYSKYPQLDKFGLNRHKFPDGVQGGFSGGMLHHTHMIPKGLPGAGNILVFNNGLPYSIVTEFNPVTLEIVWEYSGLEIGYSESHSLSHSFFSATIGSAQRLPNGNTLICEGDDGRLFEVTAQHEIVWEYIFPIYDWPGLGWGQKVRPPKMTNMVYRAYRVPYDYVPQLEEPDEMAVIPPENSMFMIEPEEGNSLPFHKY